MKIFVIDISLEKLIYPTFKPMQIIEHTTREFSSDTWLISLVVGCLFLLAVAAYAFQESFRSFVQLPLSNRYFIVAGKQKNSTHPFTLILFAIGLIGLALFCTLMLNTFNPGFALNAMSFLQVLAAVFGFFGVKFLIERLLGIVFKLETLINGYVFEKLTFLNLISLGLLGASVICVFAFDRNPWVLYISSALALTGYVIGLIYSYKSNEKVIFRNFFYFILYLCALEISPFLLMYKALT